MTNQEIPPDPEDNHDIEDLKKKVPEDVWEKLQKITEDINVEIDVTNIDRDQRKVIHQIVKKLTTVISETKDVDGKKIMVFSTEYANKYGKIFQCIKNQTKSKNIFHSKLMVSVG